MISRFVKKLKVVLKSSLCKSETIPKNVLYMHIHHQDGMGCASELIVLCRFSPFKSATCNC